MVRNSINPQVIILRKIKHDKCLVLLIKRKDSDVWTIPGGKREKNETLRHAAIRETIEETGYKIRIIKSIGKYTLPKIKHMGRVFVFQGVVISGEKMTNKEVSRIEWFDIEKLPYELLPFNKDKIMDAINKKEKVDISQKYTVKDILLYFITRPIILFKLIYFYFFIKKY